MDLHPNMMVMITLIHQERDLIGYALLWMQEPCMTALMVGHMVNGLHSMGLQFEDRSMQFTVAPVHAAIIMRFQEKPSWTSKTLATEIGIPVDSLNRRIGFWTSTGVLTESVGPDADDHIFTVVDSMSDVNKNSIVNERCKGFQMAEDEGESFVASVEDQLRKEMTVYELHTSCSAIGVENPDDTLNRIARGMFGGYYVNASVCADGNYSSPLDDDLALF